MKVAVCVCLWAFALFALLVKHILAESAALSSIKAVLTVRSACIASSLEGSTESQVR